MNDAENIARVLRDFTPTLLFQIVAILAAAGVLVSVTQKVLPWLAGRVSGRRRIFIFASVPVLRLFIIVGTGVLIVQAIIRPSFENLITLMGALGIALGFAFKDYVSSLVAGIVTLYEMPYRLGDWIEIEGVYGEVKTIGMRAVKIVTSDDTAVIVPHLKLWNNLVKNANDGKQNLLCIASFYLHPRHDAALVKRTLYEVALTSPFLQIQQPIVVVVAEKPWATHYQLKAYPIDFRYQFQFITDLTIRAKAVLTDLDVEFAIAAPILPGAVS